MCVYFSVIAEPVVDGSGAITSMAYYHLQGEMHHITKENEELKAKLQRCKQEYLSQRDQLNKKRW